MHSPIHSCAASFQMNSYVTHEFFIFFPQRNTHQKEEKLFITAISSHQTGLDKMVSPTTRCTPTDSVTVVQRKKMKQWMCRNLFFWLCCGKTFSLSVKLKRAQVYLLYLLDGKFVIWAIKYYFSVSEPMCYSLFRSCLFSCIGAGFILLRLLMTAVRFCSWCS